MYTKRFKTKLESSGYLEKSYFFAIEDYVNNIIEIDGGTPFTIYPPDVFQVDGGVARTALDPYGTVFDGGTL
jgi:hypothetical protein